MFDWNDLSAFLAVARCGSTLAAARQLGVNQTTIARRTAALETALGAQLFERRADGYRLTEQGRALIARAEAIEREATGIVSLAETWRRTATGTVRLTTTDTMLALVVAPAVRDIQAAHPGLAIELIADDRLLDLMRGEADVAIRAGAPPQADGLVRLRLPDTVWGLYCSADYAERHGLPERIEDLGLHRLVLGDRAIARLGGLRWLAEAAPDAEVAIRCNTVPNLVAAVRSGLGISALPAIAAAAHGLLRCLPNVAEFRGELWLLYPETLRNAAHIRLFVDEMVPRIRAARHLIEGRTADENATASAR